jgi:hypothetical protein
MNNTGLWSSGSLIAQFHGRLNPDQIYSSEEPVLLVSKTIPIAALSSDNWANGVASQLLLDTSL